MSKFKELFEAYLFEDDPAVGTALQDKLRWFFDQAHREGWEQCRREAEALISNLPREIYSTRVTSKYIAEMEYKESMHERNVP